MDTATTPSRSFRWHDYLTINAYWFGLTTVLQTNLLITPLITQRFVDVTQQGTRFGTLRMVTLMIALLVQALAGLLSDRSPSPWGRRRPFILVGSLLNVACVVAIGASPSYAFLFGASLLSQIASNIAHGATQGLIPDLVPHGRRGRASGVKSIMELLPVVIVAMTVGKLVAAGLMWVGILVAITILLICLVITLFIKEPPLPASPGRLDWAPLGRLLAMTVAFAVIILGLGEIIKLIKQAISPTLSVTNQLLLLGLTGFLTMLVAVGFGVLISVRISLTKSEAAANPAFPWWVVTRLAFLVGANNLSGFAVYFLQGRLGIEGEAVADPASQLMMVVGLLILISAVPSGWLADRIGRKFLVASSGIGAAVGVLILILAPSMPLMYVGGAIVGAATGVFFTTNWALGTDLVPKEKAGKYLGISNVAGAGAGAVGGYLGGLIADHFSATVPQFPGLGYALMFAMFGGLFLLSSFTTVLIYRNSVNVLE